MSEKLNRPWTTQEIIDNSEDWNLSGDVALLQTLKQFSNKLITKSTEVHNKLTQLNNNLDETKLKLDLAQNKLHSLRNTQFIENRVYEDDETLPLENQSLKKEEKRKEPQDRAEFQKQFLKLTEETIYKFFDKVPVTVSDSEEDDDDIPKFILRRKDFYQDRPLPYVIGSEEWHKHSHVGLEDTSTESESEKDSDKFSDSSDDDEFPINNTQKITSSQIKTNSDTSSELDFSNRNDQISNNTNIKNVISNREDSQSVKSFPGRNFAEQLAEKLGNVINDNTTEVNTRPIQNIEPSPYGNIFFDEPPPLDDNKKPGLFSSGGGLFDDDDNEEDDDKNSIIPTNKNISKRIEKDLFDEESSDDDLFKPKKNPPMFGSTKAPIFNEEPPELSKPKKPVGGISVFGNVKIGPNKLLRQKSSSDEEDSNEKPEIKSTQTKIAPKKINLFDDDDDSGEKTGNSPQNKPPLFDEEPPELNKPKKPIGGVSVFGNVKIGPNKLLRQKSSSDEEDSSKKPEIKTNQTKTAHKKINLFDDSDDSDEKTGILPKKPPIFSEEEPELDKPKKPAGGVSVFGNVKISSDKNFADKTETKSEQPKTVPKKFNLFDDDEIPATKPAGNKPVKGLFDDEDSDDLFKTDLFSSTSKKFTSSLFDDDIQAKPEPKKRNLFEESDDFSISSKKDDVKRENISSTSDQKETSSSDNLFQENKDKGKFSLFDSPPPVDSFFDTFGEPQIKTDLFSNIKVSSSTPETKTKTENDSKFIQNVRLFDSTPPEDDWDPKSEAVDDNNDFLTDDFSEKGSSEDLFEKKQDLPEIKNEKSLENKEVPPVFSDNSKETKVLPIKKSLFDETEQENKESDLFTPKQDETTVFKPKTSPSKLKHNLNINVAALIPGQGPPKLIKKEMESNTPPSFDAVDNVQVLHSVTKDRARGSVKRRPSTRKGRKAALNHADNTESEKLIPNEQTKLSDNEEDAKSEVKLPDLTENLNKDKKLSLFDQNIEKPKVESVFNNDLFGENTKIEKSEVRLSPAKTDSKQQEKVSLFDDDDEIGGIKKADLFDNDLFSENKSVEKSEVKLPKPEQNIQKQEKVLFTDNNEFNEPISIKKPEKNDEYKPIKDTKEKKSDLSIFDEEDNDDDELIKTNQSKNEQKTDSKPKENQNKVEKPETKKSVTKLSLFDDDDETESDLFSKNVKSLPSKLVKKSLFDDDEDSDDDFFKTSASSRSGETSQAVTRKIAKVSNIKKLKNDQPDDDPLSALLK